MCGHARHARIPEVGARAENVKIVHSVKMMNYNSLHSEQ